MFIFLLFLLVPNSALASIEITEIMYDLPGSDAKREWVEVYNSGPEPVDVTTLNFVEANVKHKVKAEGERMLPPNSYAVIVDDIQSFKSDWPQFVGFLYESSFSLSNTGEQLSFTNASGTLDTILYDPALGGKGNGTTLHKIDNRWATSYPTPGAIGKVFVAREEKVSNVSEQQEVMREIPIVAKPTELTASAVIPEEAKSGTILPWVAALIAVIGIGIGAVVFRPKSKTGYTIIEEKT